MFSKLKTLKKKYSDETVEIILALYEAGRLYTQIADQKKNFLTIRSPYYLSNYLHPK